MLFLFTVVYSQLGLSRVLGSIYCSRWVRDRNPLWTTAHTLTWMQFRGHASQTCIASLLSSQVWIYTQACVYVCACTSISSSVNGVLLKNVTVRFFFFWLLGSTILLPGWFLTAAQHWSVKWKPQLHDGGVLSVSQGVQQSHRSATLTAVFNKSMMASFTCMYALATFRIFCTCRVWR